MTEKSKESYLPMTQININDLNQLTELTQPKKENVLNFIPNKEEELGNFNCIIFNLFFNCITIMIEMIVCIIAFNKKSSCNEPVLEFLVIKVIYGWCEFLMHIYMYFFNIVPGTLNSNNMHSRVKKIEKILNILYWVWIFVSLFQFVLSKNNCKEIMPTQYATIISNIIVGLSLILILIILLIIHLILNNTLCCNERYKQIFRKFDKFMLNFY